MTECLGAVSSVNSSDPESRFVRKEEEALDNRLITMTTEAIRALVIIDLM